MHKVLILHGPNLNLLGKREPELYGHTSLDEINDLCQAWAKGHQIQLSAKQSNHEGQLVDWIQEGASQKVDGIVINPAAYTHTSLAIRDAFLATQIPFIEVHLSELTTRESFRQFSYLSDIALEVITGLGAQGYLNALDTINNKLMVTA